MDAFDLATSTAMNIYEAELSARLRPELDMLAEVTIDAGLAEFDKASFIMGYYAASRTLQDYANRAADKCEKTHFPSIPHDTLEAAMGQLVEFSTLLMVYMSASTAASNELRVELLNAQGVTPESIAESMAAMYARIDAAGGRDQYLFGEGR